MNLNQESETLKVLLTDIKLQLRPGFNLPFPVKIAKKPCLFLDQTQRQRFMLTIYLLLNQGSFMYLAIENAFR